MTVDEAIKCALSMAKVILPPTASKIEIAILTAEVARMMQVDPDIIRKIWNPWKCPTILLPFLAHAISVDVWSKDWSEEQKRKVIAASPAVHRLKGTRAAVDRTLKAFNIDSRVIEWWEDDSRRGTFRVEMLYYNGGPLFDLDLQQYAIDSVIAAKPKARVFTSRAVITARGNVYHSAYPKAIFLRVAHPYQFTPPTVRASNYIATTPVQFISATAHSKV